MLDYAGIQYRINEQPNATKKQEDTSPLKSNSIFSQPYLSASGRKHDLSDFRALLRKYCIQYGFFDANYWKDSLYADPIVDTFAEVLAR